MAHNGGIRTGRRASPEGGISPPRRRRARRSGSVRPAGCGGVCVSGRLGACGASVCVLGRYGCGCAVRSPLVCNVGVVGMVGRCRSWSRCSCAATHASANTSIEPLGTRLSPEQRAQLAPPPPPPSPPLPVATIETQTRPTPPRPPSTLAARSSFSTSASCESVCLSY